MKILVVYYHPEPPEATRATILDHLHVLDQSPREHDITYYNTADDLLSVAAMRDDTPIRPPSVATEQFDAAVLHYTLLSMRAADLAFFRWKTHTAWIGELDCPKIAIPQDEGSYAGTLDEWLFELGVNIIFSIHYTPKRALYRRMRECAAIYPCFPGYINQQTAEALQPTLTPISQRKTHIAYRARNLPYRIGRYSQLKHSIAAMASAAERDGLVCDVSTRPEDTIFGDAWLPFLGSSKTVIGVQGGYSAIDWHGELPARLANAQLANPALTFEQFNDMMEADWDGHDWLTVTPRHFEAIMTQTAQVLVAGSYKGVLQPDVHYIPLEPDLSNLEEVFRKVRDDQLLQDLVDRASADIYESKRFTYRSFAEQIDRALDALARNSTPTMPDDAQPAQPANPTVEALQRELIAARHQNAMVAQRMSEFRYEVRQMVHDTALEAFGTGTESLRLNPPEAKFEPGDFVAQVAAECSQELAKIAGQALDQRATPLAEQVAQRVQQLHVEHIENTRTRRLMLMALTAAAVFGSGVAAGLLLS